MWYNFQKEKPEWESIIKGKDKKVVKTQMGTINTT